MFCIALNSIKVALLEKNKKGIDGNSKVYARGRHEIMDTMI